MLGLSRTLRARNGIHLTRISEMIAARITTARTLIPEVFEVSPPLLIVVIIGVLVLEVICETGKGLHAILEDLGVFLLIFGLLFFGQLALAHR